MSEAPAAVAARRVAVYGGSFDPPHVGHVLAVAWLLSAAPVDAVWIFPSFDHAFGKALSEFDLRCRLADEAFALFGPTVQVRRDERGLGAGGRTLALVEQLRHQHPDLALRLVLGTDQVQARARWYRFEAVVALAPPIVLGRPGYAGAPGLEPTIALPDVSSTMVRQRVRDGLSVEGLVPRGVAAQIAAQGLYRGGAA